MMFQKILIAEDHESSNISIRKALEDLGIAHGDYVYYCDDAYSRILQAVKNNDPYQVLITDLSFEDDGIPQTLKSGNELIKSVSILQPDLKIIVFSGESKPAMIDQLFKQLGIDAYVRKARRDVSELKQAIETVSQNRKYLSTGLRQAIRETNTYEFNDYDIVLINLLAKGMLQKEIPVYLQKHNIKPFGLSSIEKRLNHIKESLNISKNEQLIAFCKDIGVI